MARGGSVELVREVPLARRATVHYLREVLGAMAERSRTGALAFNVNLGGAVGGANLSVPVELTVAPREPERDGALTLEIRARESAMLYPTLTAAIDAEELDPAKTLLRLQGAYDVPGGFVGGGLNSLVLHGLAEGSVAQWFDEVVAAIGADAARRASEERNRII